MRFEPLVSCIMPTADRQKFVDQAVEMFHAQTWPNRELVVVDDGKVAVQIAAHPQVRVIRLRGKALIGEKRNVACSHARGEIIAHWDDDDAYAADRIEDQATRLIESGKQVTGYHSMLFLNLDTGELFRWKYSERSGHVVGVSLMYRKEFWRMQPFGPAMRSGEEIAMIQRARNSGQIVTADAGRRIVATIHAGNTSPRVMKGKQWERVAA